MDSDNKCRVTISLKSSLLGKKHKGMDHPTCRLRSFSHTCIRWRLAFPKRTTGVGVCVCKPRSLRL